MSDETDDANSTRAEDKAHPLSWWMRGTLTLHFVGGGSLALEASAEWAKTARLVWASERGPDELEWWHRGWLSMNPDQIAAVTWYGHEDLGFPLTPEERAAQVAQGHWHGPLRTLVDGWRDKDEPSFSGLVLRLLSNTAKESPPEEVLRIARLCEGETGASLARSAVARAHAEEGSTPEPEADVADDGGAVEPEDTDGMEGERSDRDDTRGGSDEPDSESAADD